MGKNKNKKRKVVVEEPEEKDLNRFAGSSGEEDNDEMEEEQHDENDIPVVHPGDDDEENDAEKEESEDEEEVEAVSDNDEVEAVSDKDEVEEAASGMAQAMARILGTQSKAGTGSAVLSKTVTPLQRMAKKEKELAKEAREKRRANRERNLTALHIPLSVATTRSTLGSTSLVQELEMERMHRRVATRGVVALFNAISQHQKDAKVIDSASTTNKDSDVKHMTKHGFLDMIKSSAKDVDKKQSKKSEMATSSKPKWNALSDDFMIDSSKKLKDWDKESSEDEAIDDPNAPVDDNWSDQEEKVEKPASSGKKRRKVTAQ